jgi:hypothetical protein
LSATKIQKKINDIAGTQTENEEISTNAIGFSYTQTDEFEEEEEEE